jgi:dipeptidyl-peptidase 4
VAESFPRQQARTRRFTLGEPRSFKVAADGSRVLFLRSPTGGDPGNALWAFDLSTGRERVVVDPEQLGHAAGEQLSVEERARRERMRETAGGIVAYAIDRDARIAAFALSGTLFIADLVTGALRELDVPTPVFDPRPDPTGARVAFVHGQALYTVRVADGEVTKVADDDAGLVGWGAAEFIAAEEMSRERGYWWSPDGQAVLATRVDEAPVQEIWISDAATPAARPRAIRYPRAGTPNALVEAWVLSADGSVAVRVEWDRGTYPYLATGAWDRHGPLISVQSRDQRRVVVLAVDPVTGTTDALRTQANAGWVDLVDGVPARLSDGRLVSVEGVGDTLALIVGGQGVTPANMEVRSVIEVSDAEVLFTASTDPLAVAVWRWEASSGELTRLTPEDGVHMAAAGGGVHVIGAAGMGNSGSAWSIAGHVFESHAEEPCVEPSVELMTVGERRLRVGLLVPTGHDGYASLPVLLDPYGGPRHQRVMEHRARWNESQWLADQGFAVIVADGRGTPGRGLDWARAVSRDLAGPVLEDQVDALHEVAVRHQFLDLTRVAIRGWSFGGYLAALAVLRRPDVFHVAVAGAPVTDWRLYDTHYTERYLGVEPDGTDRQAYEGSSLLLDAGGLTRPLLIIHGLADDNVVVANTLQLSQRLTEAGRLHSVLPLSGITHMTPQEAVAEHLLTVQLDFIRQALGITNMRSPRG